MRGGAAACVCAVAAAAAARAAAPPHASHTRGKLAVKGERSVFRLTKNDAEVLGTFKDGSPGPAAIRAAVGKGSVTYAAFHPGISYFDPAIPTRPADRGSVDESFAYWVPTEFHVGARDFVSAPLAGVAGARPVTSSNPLVEVGIITADSVGTALPCINWQNVPEKAFTVSLNFAVSFKAATLASGAPIASSSNTTTGFPSFTFDIDVADAIILR